MRIIAALVLILAAAVLAFVAMSPRSVAQPTAAPTGPTANQQLSPEEARLREEWRVSMPQIALPKKGCFESSYPNKEWREVQCSTTKVSYPMPPRSGPRPQIVGNNNDVSAKAPFGFISSATGSFDTVSGVTSESGPIANSGPSVANAYTLQLNTNFMSVCSGSPNPGCRAWEQFVYENNPSVSRIFIQYWLIQYNTTCPQGAGWQQQPVSGIPGINCLIKNNSMGPVDLKDSQGQLIHQPITNLSQLSLTGSVDASGDSLFLFAEGKFFATKGDNPIDLAGGWRIAEFNVFGDGGNSAGASQASFNSGSTIVPRTRITYGAGTGAPTCVAQGFTGETNNLSFGPTAPSASGPGPALLFAESSAGGAMSNCAAATGVGDTHLTTFGGLLYDFQASGDFVLAQVDNDFVVQTRQVSGAPSWPNASVNSAVATQMGNNKVAICLAEPRLSVDGVTTDLGDGKTFSTPDGVDVTRRGNVYYITSQSGDSVRATVNAKYIDVSVGLGQWPANVSGLLSNPKGNVNQLAARDGTVFTNAFSFADIYQRFGESWRVPAGESLLSACGDRVERGNPERPFYAKDLPPELYNHARAVCTAAGVKEGALLDACTLDVAVIGDDKAAQIFVNAPEPVAVGNPVVHKTPGLIKWLLLLILIVIILLLLLFLKKRKTP